MSRPAELNLTHADINSASVEQLTSALATWRSEAATRRTRENTERERILAAGVGPQNDAEVTRFAEEFHGPTQMAMQMVNSITERLDVLRANQAILAPDRTFNNQGSAPAPAQSQNFRTWSEAVEHRMASTDGFSQWMERARDVAGASYQSTVEWLNRNPMPPIEAMTRNEFNQFKRGGFMATTVTGGGATSAGAHVFNDVQPGIVDNVVHKPRAITALVGTGSTDSDAVEYIVKTAVINAAAMTAEDSALPEGAQTWTTASTQVRNVGVYIPITNRALQDAGQLRTYLEEDLVADTFETLEEQVVAGDGTGQNFTGIYTTSGLLTRALGGDTRVDAILKASTQTALGVNKLRANTVALHTNDWQELALVKDTAGSYVLGGPAIISVGSVWGLRIVESEFLTDGTPIVGNFARGARLWTRTGISVVAGWINDDFVKEKITLRASMRAAFVVQSPEMFCTITGF